MLSFWGFNSSNGKMSPYENLIFILVLKLLWTFMAFTLQELYWFFISISSACRFIKWAFLMYHDYPNIQTTRFTIRLYNGLLKFIYDWVSRFYPFYYQIPSLLTFHFFNKEYPETILQKRETHGLSTPCISNSWYC